MFSFFFFFGADLQFADIVAEPFLDVEQGTDTYAKGTALQRSCMETSSKRP